MRDTGGWGPEVDFAQLVDIFPDETLKLDARFGSATGNEGKTAMLRQFIEEQGFDHIVYHNTVEEPGSLAVIHWKPEQMVSMTDPKVTGGQAQNQAQAMAAYVMGGVFAIPGKEK